MEIDQEQARELEIFYENDSQIYKNSQAWVDLYNKKKKKGNYIHAIAVNGIKNNFIPQVITKYNKEYGKIGIVNNKTKEYLAERWVKEYEEENK